MMPKRIPAAPLRRPEELSDELRPLWQPLRAGSVLLIHRLKTEAMMFYKREDARPLLACVEIKYTDATQLLNVGYVNPLLVELQREPRGFYPGWEACNLPGDEYRIYIYP